MKAATQSTLRIAHLVRNTQAEGPGTRFALWLQGCPLRCEGCCNPDYLPVEGGRLTAVDKLVQQITTTPNIEGITLLGGEPFFQAEAAGVLAAKIQAHGLSVMIFSGYTLTALRLKGDAADKLLKHTDLLVDGPFALRQRSKKRRWIGSDNQQIHYLTARYSAETIGLASSNTVEIHFQGDQISILGWPEGVAELTGKLNA